jgi:branched-chain amino acid aminotransferase
VTRILSAQEVLDRLQQSPCEHQQGYLAMYSSWYGGIVTDPSIMLLPIDDHIVHRGDGIFEAFKCLQGRVYLLDRHLDRLERSAALIDLGWPVGRSDMERLILETIMAAGTPDCLIRLYVSRGPGDFSPSPSACRGSQLYIVVTGLSRTDPAKYEKGCSLMTSSVPIKTGFFANVKSCNYLPNVLMKKEAEEHDVDYALSLDESGLLAEGPTENIGLISEQDEFLVPRFERILRGTTVQRMLELAQGLVSQGLLRDVRQAPLSIRDLEQAKEIMMFGTTFDVLPVVAFDGREVAGGRPGPMFRTFLDLLRQDQANCREVLTPVE